MQPRGGITELMRQAARIQRKIDQAKAALKDKELVFVATGDRVKVTATYGGKISRIEVDPTFLEAEGLDFVLDGVCAGVNGALEMASKGMEAELEKATGGVKIPGVT